MKRVLIFASVSEAATGLALLIIPSLVGQLLLGDELTGVAIPVARVAGIALIALGVACWPGPPLVGRPGAMPLERERFRSVYCDISIWRAAAGSPRYRRRIAGAP
jgi:hypothetical protein